VQKCQVSKHSLHGRCVPKPRLKAGYPEVFCGCPHAIQERSKILLRKTSSSVLSILFPCQLSELFCSSEVYIMCSCHN
jgi:hypothetical protein